jgi:hypothetical protein
MSIWGSAADDYWMAGWLVLAHWDGSSWSRYRVRGTDGVDVWGSARDDVWTATIEYTRYDQIAHLWHWDGQTWSEVDFTSRGIAAIGGHSRTEAWVVSDHLYRWDGSQLKPVGRTGFRHIRGAPNEVWGVGYNGVLRWTPPSDP